MMRISITTSIVILDFGQITAETTKNGIIRSILIFSSSTNKSLSHSSPITIYENTSGAAAPENK